MADERNDGADAVFASRMAARLPRGEVPPALTARIMADFDRATARRNLSWRRVLADLLWPGAPLWRPGMVLAASLFLGLTAGFAVPAAPPAAGESAATQTQQQQQQQQQQWTDTSPALDMLGDL
jgi:hypothetical protein